MTHPLLTRTARIEAAVAAVQRWGFSERLAARVTGVSEAEVRVALDEARRSRVNAPGGAA